MLPLTPTNADPTRVPGGMLDPHETCSKAFTNDQRFATPHRWRRALNGLRLLVFFALLIATPVAAQQGAIADRADGILASSAALQPYREELARFRREHGGGYDLPPARFFLFGMGLRSKYAYANGVLAQAPGGEVVRRWDVNEDVILPPAYSVTVASKDGAVTRIVEDGNGVWLVEKDRRERLPGTEFPVKLPDFGAHRFPSIMRVLHQELLVNVTTNGPVPNFYVYPKPWFRDGAMMAMVFKETGNLDCIRPWILGLNEVFDRNNAGETEADNPGQVLYLLSLVSDKNHPLVPKILAEAARFERDGAGGKHILGRSDFANHPVYQTKWMKFGLRSLGLADPYTVPAVADGYSALFWMDYRDAHVAGKDSDDRRHYPYLGWACDHFHGAKKSPISNQDYPLTWEAHASQARHEGIKPLSDAYVTAKLAAPHTWHAAEVFLYLLHARNRL